MGGDGEVCSGASTTFLGNSSLSFINDWRRRGVARHGPRADTHGFFLVGTGRVSWTRRALQGRRCLLDHATATIRTVFFEIAFLLQSLDVASPVRQACGRPKK